MNDSNWKIDNKEATSLTKGDTSVFFLVKNLSLEKIKISLSDTGDLMIMKDDKQLIIQSIDENELQISVSGLKKTKSLKLIPGKEIKFILEN